MCKSANVALQTLWQVLAYVTTRASCWGSDHRGAKMATDTSHLGLTSEMPRDNRKGPKWESQLTQVSP